MPAAEDHDGESDPAVALHCWRARPTRLDIERIGGASQADQRAAEEGIPVSEALHLGAAGVSRFGPFADGAQGQAAAGAKEPEPDAEH